MCVLGWRKDTCVWLCVGFDPILPDDWILCSNGVVSTADVWLRSSD